MKKLLIIALSFVIISGTAQTLNDKGLYVDNDGELYTGIVQNERDGIRTEYSVKSGEIEGPANYFYASGRIMETGAFTKGQKDLKWTRFSETGNITAIAFYKLGKKDGTWLVFDEKGNKRMEMVYVDGSKSGTWTNWDADGKIISSKDYSKLN